MENNSSIYSQYCIFCSENMNVNNKSCFNPESEQFIDIFKKKSPSKIIRSDMIKEDWSIYIWYYNSRAIHYLQKYIFKHF